MVEISFFPSDITETINDLMLISIPVSLYIYYRFSYLNRIRIRGINYISKKYRSANIYEAKKKVKKAQDRLPKVLVITVILIPLVWIISFLLIVGPTSGRGVIPLHIMVLSPLLILVFLAGKNKIINELRFIEEIESREGTSE